VDWAKAQIAAFGSSSKTQREGAYVVIISVQRSRYRMYRNGHTGMININCSSWLSNRFPAVTWWAFTAISNLSPALGAIHTPHCKESGTIFFYLKTFTLRLPYNRTWSTLIVGKISGAVCGNDKICSRTLYPLSLD
jgi:hypothetical protein